MIPLTEDQEYDKLSTAEIRAMAVAGKPGAMEQLHRRSKELRAEGHPPAPEYPSGHGYRYSYIPI